MILYELEPCRECGSESISEYSDNARPDDGYRLFICQDCRYETPWSSSLREAVRLWNDIAKVEIPG